MAGIGIAGAVKLIAPKAKKRTLEIANHLRGIAYELHKNAPRGGYHPNLVGEERSLPGDPPASELGDLLEILARNPVELADGYEVNVNYVNQEFGGSFVTPDTEELKHYEPRPLGRLSIERLKREL